MLRVALNGTDLFYRQVGAGTPCLVMHGGLGADHSQFRRGLGPQLVIFVVRGWLC